MIFAARGFTHTAINKQRRVQVVEGWCPVKSERTPGVSLWKRGLCVHFGSIAPVVQTGRQRYLLGHSDPDIWQPARVHYTGTSSTTLMERRQSKINHGFVAKKACTTLCLEVLRVCLSSYRGLQTCNCAKCTSANTDTVRKFFQNYTFPCKCPQETVWPRAVQKYGQHNRLNTDL